MKRFLGLTAIIFLSFHSSFAQQKKEIVTEKIHVSGVCGQCKKRIEDAAYIPGVKRAEWDKQSKELTVSYRSDKTSIKTIAEKVAATGHDAGSVQASQGAYSQLPECCAYKDDHTDH